MRSVSWMLFRERRRRAPTNTMIATTIAMTTRAVIATNKGSMRVAYRGAWGKVNCSQKRGRHFGRFSAQNATKVTIAVLCLFVSNYLLGSCVLFAC